jgi:hypothetical protein
MPETTEVNFSHREIAEMLVKKQGIHEGIWGISVRFNWSATNVGPSPTELYPSAIASIVQIGLHRVEKESNIAVDAAKVNPKSQEKHPKVTPK